MTQGNALTRWGSIGNFILIGGGAFCILVVFYFFYHYALTGERQFTSPVGVILYYCLPAGLATLMLSALCLEHNYKINLAIFFVSLGVSIYSAELFLTFSDMSSSATQPIWGDQIKKRKYEILELANEFGVRFDTRSKLEVIDDLRAKNIEAVPYVTPMGFLKQQEDGSLQSELTINGTEVIPLGGLSNSVTVFCNETGEYSIYVSDEHGFHNPKGIWQSDRVPIVAVGDSYTQGGCVPSDKNFVALIRHRYPGTLNLGMAGEGPLTMLAAVKEYLPGIRPKIVLWFYHEESDIEDLEREERSHVLMRYLANDFSQNLLTRQSDIDQAVLNYVERYMIKERTKEQQGAAVNPQIGAKLMGIAKLGTLREKFGLVVGMTNTEKSGVFEITDVELELFRTILSQAKATTATWGGTLYFINLPAWERYGNLQLASKTGARYRNRVLSLVKKLDIPIIDVHPAFQARKDPLSLFSFRRFGHYNEEGHRLVAEEVLRSIATEN